jgi:molybdate transport system substrate-binding protein
MPRKYLPNPARSAPLPVHPAGHPAVAHAFALRRLITLRAAMILTAGLLPGFTLTAQSGEVQVAVATNFAGPLAKIGDTFTAASGHTLKVSVGATGKFATQIQAGAPFELLIAADDETPRKLIAKGLAVKGSNFTYAIGKLVLWSARPGVVDADGQVLAGKGYEHLAIANPKVAPYGAAGMEVLKARGLLDAVTPRLVTAESIAQTFQFVSTGNAELGFVALSQVAVPGKPVTGSWWLVPSSLYGEIRQDAVLLKAGEKNPAATALLDYLKSAPAKAVIASYGYGH